jgi:2'-5' RNA ligase
MECCIYIQYSILSFPDRQHSSHPPQRGQDWPCYEPVTDAAQLRRFVGITIAGAAEQLSLAGMETDAAVYEPSRLPGEHAPLGYGVFFAGFAEPGRAEPLRMAGQRLMREHGLRDALQSEERAHVTLCSLNGPASLNRAQLDAARAAANSLHCPVLPMVFDRARSFSADGAFMLLGDKATDTAVARLRRPLMAALKRFGLKPDEVRLAHMTMVYNCGKVVEERSIPPLTWTMRRFALVLSHVGNTRHEILAEWTLPRP